MRIGIVTATNWPHVRRGGERFVNELAAYLATRGHEVTVLSAGPERGSRSRRDGYTTVMHRRLWHPALARLGVHEAHVFMATGLARLVRGRFDVVQCTSFLDTFAATVARRVTGTPVVFWVNSVPPPVPYVRALTLGGRVFRRAMRDADEVVALSDFVRRYLADRFGRGGLCLPVPVDTVRFQLVDRCWTPTIVCGAALDDERKGGALLLRAFNGVKRMVPDAVLRLVAPIPDRDQRRLIEYVEPPFRAAVRFDPLDSSAVPLALGHAALSVLPALWESFGMVVMESMACGTPVVGARHGALPELIDDGRTGCLFDPGPPSGAAPTNAAGLTSALLDGLALSRDPRTRHRCRARAEEGSWPAIGPRFEAVYERVTARSGLAGRAAGRPA
jgi:phosphatidylinositol alpha-mannosyltransferase